MGETEAFRYEVDDDKKGTLVIKFSGYLNEDVNLGEILGLLADLKETYNVVKLDLGKVSKINSCGIREWLLFIEGLKGVTPYRFGFVSGMFIEQTCMIPRMLGEPPAPVDSFEAPYYCSKCDEELAVVLKAEQVKKPDGTFSVPKVKCGTCGGPVEFDAIEEEFFSFFKGPKK